MEWFAGIFTRHRPWVGAFLAALSLLFLFGLSRLSIDDVPSSIFRSDDEDFARLEQLFRDFGSDDNDCIVVLEAETVFSPEGVRAIRELDKRLTELEGVSEAVSLADVPVFDGGLLPRPLLPPADAGPEELAQARERAAQHPLVAGRLLSDDGATTIVVARLEGAHLPVATLRTQVDAVRQAIAEATAGSGTLRARLTGVPAIRVVIFEAIAREQKLFSALGALLSFAVGIAIFRRLGPLLSVSGASILAGFWALGLMGLMGQPMNLLTTELPLLVIVIAFTDAVHLMIDAERRRREGLSPMDSCAHAIRHLGLPCALTSLTTAVGFGSLAVSRIEVMQRFGMLFAAAVGMTFVAVLTSVPLFASFLLERLPPTSMAERFSGLHGPAERLVRWIVRHARGVGASGVLLTIALLFVALQLVPDNRLTESTPRGDEAVEVLLDLEQSFGGALTAAVLVEWPEGRAFPDPEVVAVLEAVRRTLDESEFTRAPLSVLDLLSLLPGDGSPVARAGRLDLLPADLVGRFLRSDLRRALVTAHIPDEGSAVADPAYAALEDELAAIRAAHPGFSVHLTGTGYVARRNVNVMIGDFAAGLMLAAAVIFVVLTAAFRSFVLGAISVLPNALPLVAAAAVLVLLGVELQIVSVLAFTVCLGIAVDDTIHLITRFKRELALDGNVEEAVVRAFLGVGRALVVTTVVLLAGFGVMFLSAIPTSRLFGLIAVVGLLTALLGDLFFLPALLVVCLGRRTRVRSRVRP